MPKKFKILFSTLVVFFMLFPDFAYSQIDSTGVAQSISIEGEDIEDGNLICTKEGGLGLCEDEYLPSIYGVITDDPAIVLDQSLENQRFVVTSGIAKIRVSAVNGNITAGDLVTSSAVRGVAQKATRNGYVLGLALEAFESENPEDEGSILVALDIHPAISLGAPGVNLLEVLRSGLSSSLLEPVASLRYILAAAIVLIAFVLAFVYFGRAASVGIEAIGRNPLARRTIQLSIILHIVLTIVIVAVGLFLAYLILIL